MEIFSSHNLDIPKGLQLINVNFLQTAQRFNNVVYNSANVFIQSARIFIVHFYILYFMCIYPEQILTL